ncbi:unnamed protein product [Alopecurus aequalis]
MSIMQTATTCRAELEQGEHLFKISDYSVHKGMGVGWYIQSSVFVVGGHHWCLHYYPDGSTEDGMNDMVVVLDLMKMNPDAGAARVSSTISLFDWKTKRFSSSVAKSTNLPDPNCSVAHNINRGVMEASGCYVVDDRLTIKCAVTIIMEPYVWEEVDDSNVEEAESSDITEGLGKLLETEEHADVTFEVQGEECPAHKLVLAMRCPYFKAAFYGPMKEKDSNRIVIDDMQPAVFKVLLRFIYTDSLIEAMGDDLDGDDKKEVTKHLLVAADRYGMEKLKDMCESILCKDLDAESVATTLALAKQHSCSELQDACIRFIASCTKIDDVLASGGYNRLKRTSPDTVMEMWEKASRLRKT